MKKQFLAMSAFLISGFSAQAAVAPYWQSIREMNEILNSKELAEELKTARPIDAIERELLPGGFGYRVSAGGCTVPVAVIYLAPDVHNGVPMIGAQKFKIEVGLAECK